MRSPREGSWVLSELHSLSLPGLCAPRTRSCSSLAFSVSTIPLHITLRVTHMSQRPVLMAQRVLMCFLKGFFSSARKVLNRSFDLSLFGSPHVDSPCYIVFDSIGGEDNTKDGVLRWPPQTESSPLRVQGNHRAFLLSYNSIHFVIGQYSDRRLQLME